LIINPGDIKTEQQQPGLLSVAVSRAKTMGDMTNDMPNPRNSAVYWIGCGMSINRVLHGSTKKQMHTQGQERVNCLKIKKRENLVNYLTEQCKNTSSQQYNKKKLKKIKNEKSNRRRRNTNGCVAIHNKYYHKPKQKLERTQVERLSDDTNFFSLNTNTMR
jgi:hypothetical protein